VPQGSVLGPLLFLIYIDDVIRVPFSVGSKLVLYADDMLLYRKIDIAVVHSVDSVQCSMVKNT